MKQFSKKLILASEEFKKTSAGSFFEKLGFEITSDYDPSKKEEYSFAIDDYQKEINTIARLKTEKGSGFSAHDRAFVDFKNLNPTTQNLLENYFSDQEELDLVDRYSKNHKDIITVKIQDYLNIGYFIDLIIVEAYKNGFDINLIRNYLNEGVSTIFQLSEEKGSTLPIDISFSHDGNVFAVQIMTSLSSFDLSIDVLSRDNFNLKFVESNNFVDFTYLEMRQKLMVTALWIKDNPKFRGCFFTTVARRSKDKKPDINVQVAKADNETRYQPTNSAGKNDLSLLGLARKFAMFIKNKYKDDLAVLNDYSEEKLIIDLKSYPISSEVEAADREVYQKTLQILKNNSEDIKTVVSGDTEEDKSKTVVSGSKEEEDKTKTVVSGDNKQTPEEKKIISGNEEEDKSFEKISNTTEIIKDEKIVLGSDGKPVEKEYIEKTDLSTAAKNAQLESELKLVKIKLDKSLEQSVKMKKLLDQFKTEYNKLKDAKRIEVQKDQTQASLEDGVAAVVENSKLLDLKKDLLSTRMSEKNLQKLNIDLVTSNEAKDERIKTLEQRLENMKAEYQKSKEFAAVEKMHQLESENKILQTKVEVISKNLSNATSNNAHKESDLIVRKEKEIETLKSQIQMAHTLVSKFKTEKNETEDRFKLELDTLKKKFMAKEQAAIDKQNDPHTQQQKAIDEKVFEEKIHAAQLEKKAIEDKFKEQGLEMKKLEHRLKIVTSQLEEATKKKGAKGGATSNDTYIKQLEYSNKKLAETSTDLTEKKKDIIKLKTDNAQLTSKLAELEKKLAAYEKKAA